MLSAAINVFKIPELRQRIFFTLGLLFICRIVTSVPTPGVDAETTATPGENKYYLMPVRVTVATLKCSDQPEATEKFAQWLASPAAAEVLKKFGFTTPDKAVVEFEDGKRAIR